MQYANQVNARYVAVIGDEELKKGQVDLKEMATGDKKTVSLEQLVPFLTNQLSN
jgi:histidyl-tRNA synthetase